MRRRLRLLGVLTATVTAVALLAGCGSDESAATGSAHSGHTTATLDSLDPVPVAQNPATTLPVTVRSLDGADVTITDASRIVAADRYGTLAQTVYALGLGDNLVGRSTAAAFPAVEDVPNVTPGGNSLNAEAILALQPTVFLTDTTIGPKAVQDQLRAAGVPVVYFDPNRTMAGVTPQITAVANALGVPEQGAALAQRTQSEIDAATAGVPQASEKLRIAFVYLRGTAITMLAGPGSGADSLIEALGAIDAGTASGLTQPFVPITSEAMIAAAPDLLLTMTDGLESIGGVAGLEKIPGIAQTPAGRNQRVVDMDDSVLLSFGPNTGHVLAALSEAIYPQQAQ
ncbi:heme/hemin ABC transporter substrate-binding protein [Aldersonia kunmingensis]|uniref:heme/hemin ABC transporter substrate-binding protein n=1 Tax=Aldersonia kunmingensis TaxID=408066 RepID=UPI00083764D0|nr:ABC transporter substrate-binding protein [Aldersonia kunmingensis]